jgi:ADP-ribose diphosphatase
MLKHWKQTSSEILYDNSWWTYKMDRFQIPDGVTGEYHYVHTHGSSMIVPVTDEGKIVLVNQYRYLCRRESIEFPCGSVNKGNTHMETAHLELGEETGFRSDTMEELGEFNPYNGVTDEICKVFLARGLQITTAKPDETEEFELLIRSADEIEAMIRDNTIWDGMTLSAWMLARSRL